jgi:hypothetical protein
MDKYEELAKRHCEIRGLDPYSLVTISCPDGHPGCLVAHYGPLWMNYVEEAKAQEAWRRTFNGSAE